MPQLTQSRCASSSSLDSQEQQHQHNSDFFDNEHYLNKKNSSGNSNSCFETKSKKAKKVREFSSNNICLDVYYTNAGSLVNKIDELRLYASLKKPHIIAITETWFDLITLPMIDNYTLYRKDRGARGGGVCIYVDENLKSSKVALDVFKSDELEQCWCKISINTERILVGCIYRPTLIRRECQVADNVTHKARDQILLKVISLIRTCLDKRQFTGVLLTGDFNFNKIVWEAEGYPIIKEGSKNRTIENEFVDALYDNFLYQNVFFPTFQTAEDQVTSTIDLVISECPARLLSLRSGPVLGASSHGHTSLIGKYQIMSPFPKKSLISKRNFRKANFSLVSELLSNIEWEEKLRLLDACKAYRLFLSEYESICNQAVPLIKPIERIKPKWLNAEVKKGIKLKHELWYKMKSKGKCQTLNKTELLTDYKRTCKILKKNIKNSIVKIEIELAVSSKNNPKILYAYIKSQQKCKDSVRLLRTEKGDEIADPAKLAEYLNCYF